MSDLLTLRMDLNDKKALALSSLLSEMPISKVIMPYLGEGTRTALGSILLYHIDRSVTFDKRAFEVFTTMVMEPTRTGSSIVSERPPDEVNRTSPKVVWTFFDLLVESKGIQRMNETFEEVKLHMGTSYVTPSFLRSLCYRIGDEYLTSGGSLDRLDYQMASETFFNVMLERFYHFNATGTSNALSSEMYLHQGLMKDLAREMADRYAERTRTRKFEAIEVQSAPRSRGRPAKKIRKALPAGKVVAREITDG